MNQEQAQEFFKQHGIRYVLAQFVDIHGAAKAKAVPVQHLEMVLTDGAGFAGFALWGFGMGPEGPDYMAVGDLSTLQVIPWMPGYARLICNGVVNKKSYPYCSRVALQTQLERLSRRGMTLYTGIEPEFMLLTNKVAEETINNTVFAWQTYAITRVSTNQPRTIGVDFQYKF